MAHHFLNSEWINKRLRNKNAVFTPGSETTVMINYSDPLHILEVEFTGGRVYHYQNVDLSTWEEYKSTIQSGGSSGIFVNTKIKPFYEAVEIT